MYLNTVVIKVFAIVFVFEKFVVFVFVFKYYAMYLDPSLDLTHLIFFELRRVIDENACKELLNQIPVKKIAQQAQRENNADFKTKNCAFCHFINTFVLT